MALSLDSSSNRRGRRRGRSRRALAEINVTPMVDVMLVLLVIFMVAAPLLTAGVDIELPKTEAGALNDEQEPVAITVSRGGVITVDETEVPFENFGPVLVGIAEGQLDRPIHVRADGATDWTMVARVMAALQKANFTSIGLVTETGGPSSGGDPAPKDGGV